MTFSKLPPGVQYAILRKASAKARQARAGAPPKPRARPKATQPLTAQAVANWLAMNPHRTPYLLAADLVCTAPDVRAAVDAALTQGLIVAHPPRWGSIACTYTAASTPAPLPDQSHGPEHAPNRHTQERARALAAWMRKARPDPVEYTDIGQQFGWTYDVIARVVTCARAMGLLVVVPPRPGFPYARFALADSSPTRFPEESPAP